MVTEDNVLGRIAEFDGITLLSGGEGHAIGDVITLSEEGSTVVGTGALTVATLGGALNTPGEITKYPTGIINTGTAGAISVKDVAGNTVVLGAMQPGIVRKFSFSQVMGAGTGPAVGEVTILY